MTEYAKPVPGNFCWTEVFLDDPVRGKGFYGELFGWASQDMPSPDGPYAMLHLGGKFVAGVGKLTGDMKKAGVRPYWLTHVCVSDVEDATNKAQTLGAKVVKAPVRMGQGIMAIVSDPTGGVISLFSTTASMGTFLWGEDNALCWNELTTTNAETGIKFYTELFGWTTESWNMGNFTYTILKNDDVAIAGLMPHPPEMAGAPTSWTPYFAVADCDATVKKAEKLGARVCMGPHDIPDVGRFAILGDLEGAVFAVLKPLPGK